MNLSIGDMNLSFGDMSLSIGDMNLRWLIEMSYKIILTKGNYGSNFNYVLLCKIKRK